MVELPGESSESCLWGRPFPGQTASNTHVPSRPMQCAWSALSGGWLRAWLSGAGGRACLAVACRTNWAVFVASLPHPCPGRILVASFAQAGPSLTLSLFFLFACLVGPLGAGRIVGRVGVNHNHDLAALELAPLELAPLGAGTLGAGLGVLLFGLQLCLPCERSIRSWPISGN